MAKKIIGVDNLNVIRDFILSKVMAESDDIRRTLTEESADYLHNKLLEASESLKTDYESKYEHLNNRIETLKSEGVNSEELQILLQQLDALENNYVDMQNGLSAIEDSIADIESSVMSPGQLNELIDTALIERTTITEDMVETPNVYTQNLVALIAKFGTVRALNIVGDEIEGKTISAYDKISGTDEPTWKLDRQGNGYLANKNISWDKDGNVTFGENVKIGWNNEWDEKIPEIPEGGLTESEVESMISTEISKYEVKAENIKGTTLEGKTIKSSDDAWKLDRRGDGYLAKGNISWDADGNVEFGSNVKLGWSNIDGPSEQYKLTANIPYLRRKDSGRVDYNNEKNDPLLSIISDKGTGDKMFTITVKEYNSTTGEYDKSITDTIRLYRLLTYTDGTTHKPGYAEAPNGVYSGPDTQATAWLNLKNIRFYLIENDTTKCLLTFL